MTGLDLELELMLGAGEVQAFAELTGDFSSLHMDAEFARRTRYRRRVVHGMLPVSLLACLGRDLAPGRSLRFQSLEVRFQRPIHLGDAVRIEASAKPMEGGEDGALAVEAQVFALNGPRPELATTVRGAARLKMQDEVAPQAVAGASLLAAPLDEARYRLAELNDRVESLRLRADTAAFAGYLATICPQQASRIARPCANLAGALTSSTLVGMRLPGRHATFRAMTLTFGRNLEPGGSYLLEGVVRRTAPAATLAQADLCIRDGGVSMASGALDVLVNPPPGAMPGMADLSAESGGPDLKGRVIVVVGGSRGLGETCAKLLAVQGARVVLTYHQGTSDAERIVGEILGAGGEASAQRCDARDPGEAERLAAAVRERYRRVDGLVYCAVGGAIPRALGDLAWRDFSSELEVSLGGFHFACNALRPLLREAGGGRVVALSTVFTRQPPKGQAAYVAAKGAVEAYVRALAGELLADNTQVNALLPQMTETDLVAAIPETLRERLAQGRAMGRHMKPVEVARAVSLLLSEWASPISGQCIVLNQGEPPFL